MAVITRQRYFQKGPLAGLFALLKTVNQKLIFLLLLFSLLPFSAHAESVTGGAGIATAHPLATQAGHDIIAAGGNAFDAAIAVTAVLAVVEPYSSGIGGGGFWLLHRAGDGKQVMLDGREMAPGRAHRDLYLDENKNVLQKASIDGPLAAGIPGVPAALERLAKGYGRLPLTKSLAPAIAIARNGFPVDSYYQGMATFRLKVLQSSPASRVFLDKGQVPALGFVIKQPDLANTLEAIAIQGRDGFYRGVVAQRLVTAVRDAGGIWSLEDLARYQVIERAPITGQFEELRIVSAAPPSSGGIAIMTILNVLAEMNFDQQTSETQHHLIVEAMRRAYRDRAQYLGDPDFIFVPTEKLLSAEHCTELCRSVSLTQATESVSLPVESVPAGIGEDTTHFSIIDAEGNRVSATLSVNYPFGSGFVAAGTGVLLNDEMDDFSAKPGVPNVYGLVGAKANAIAPYKRPLSSMSPSFVESPRGVAVLGTPGGSRIITMVLHSMLAYRRGDDAMQIVGQRRFHHQYLPDHIQYERGTFSDELAAELQFRGHVLSLRNDFGNMQVVIWDRATNKLDAASDPRGIGSASVK